MRKNKFVICIFIVTMVFSMLVQSNACPIPVLTYSNSEWEIVDGYLYGVRNGQLSDTVIADFYYSENIVASSEVIGTGSTLSYVDEDGTVTESVTVVVFGDLNGDGKVSTADYIMIKKGISDSSLITNLRFKAADVSGDGKLAAADYMRVKRHIGGKLNLYDNLPASAIPTPMPTEEPTLYTGTLIVNGQDITSGNHVAFNFDEEYIELPLLAICEALGAEINWQSDTEAEINLNNETYYLDVSENTLYSTINDWQNFIGLVPGQTNSPYYLFTGEEYIVDSSSMSEFIYSCNAIMEWDFETAVVNIYFRE